MLTIGGLIPFTTIDYPGKLSAVVFCQGCPWRCHYCHNPHLLASSTTSSLTWEGVVAFLRTRQGLLDGVVFSGGEPTMQQALPDALAEVRRMGFLTGLHTGGAYPEQLAACLPHLDWVGMDLKAPFDEYEQITGTPESGLMAAQSADLLRKSGIPLEFRTTVDPWLEMAGRLAAMKNLVTDEWGCDYTLQPMNRETFRGVETEKDNHHGFSAAIG